MFRYIFDSTHRTLTGLAVLIGLCLIGLASSFAATSYDVNNVPDMFLNVGITQTATSGITLAAPIRNSVAVTYPTTTGGILKIQQGSREELLYYAGATVNSSTKVVTLTGVVRGLCWNTFTAIRTCNDGKIFSKGASVRLVDAAQLINLKANTDRTNTYTAAQTFGSGVTLTGIRALLRLTSMTTAERDAASAANGMMIYNTTTGLINQYIGGSWAAIGTDATSDASESAAGKVELATVKDQSGATLTGDTGAATVVQTKYLTGTGGLSQRARIPYLGRIGILTGSILATGTFRSDMYPSGSGSWAYPRNLSGAIVMNSQQTGALLDVQKGGTSRLKIQEADKNYHLKISGSAPTLNANCGGSPSVTTNSTDTAGRFTPGSGSPVTCSVQFNKRYASAPICVAAIAIASSPGSAQSFNMATTATGFVIRSHASIGDLPFNYICLEI